MSDLRKAAEMALEALDCLPWQASPIAREATQALRQALAQPEQEPVAWMYVNDDGECEQIEYGEPFNDPSVTPLYTSPPSIEAVVLAERAACEKACEEFYTIEGIAQKCAAAIRARSKI